jgi:YegS/Rv2252/BmrU family lipid kinase
MNKWFFIANATAGRGRAGKKISKLITSLNEHGLDFEVELTKAPLHATELAANAIENGYRKIAVVGGDGTLNETVNGIMKSGKQKDMVLGIIPEGGGNDFSMNFNLSNKIDRAIAILKKEKTVPIDLGQIEDFFFVNALGMGFDAHVARLSNSIKHLNGLPRYIAAVLKALVNLKKFTALITLDNSSLEGSFLLCSIGNGLSTGGGFLLTPEARIDDGLLDICYIKRVTRSRFLSLLPRAIKGRHLKEPEVIIHQSREIQIKTDEILPIYFDGELPILNNPYDFKISLLPAQLNLVVG